MRLATFSILALIAAMPAYAGDDFSLPAPGRTDPSITLWATEYHVHAADASNQPDAIALRDAKGRDLGVALDHNDWCDAAMEGTVAIDVGGTVKSFNAGGLGTSDQTDCSQRFRHVSPATQANIRRQTFFSLGEADRFGLGAIAKYRLVPFRSIAVDPAKIAWGTALFVPDLRGTPVTLPDGRTVPHDGYLYAVDRGGQIKGNHIDLFVGLPPKRGTSIAPRVVSSNPARTFTALVVTDPTVVAKLRSLHVRFGS